MSRRSHLYRAEAVMLMAAVLPLAQAEGVWWYFLVAVLSVLLGAWTTARRAKPLLGPLGAKVYVLAACGLLTVEYAWLGRTPVLALSHFMILVCASKLLQRRLPRDDTQIIVLTLLVLAVASIVSSHPLFPIALAVHLTVGLNAIMQHHLRAEAARAEARNRAIHPLPPSGEIQAGGPYGRMLAGVTLLAAMTGLAVGAAVFILFPRFGAGIFRQLHASRGGHSYTGLATTLDFHAIGPIRESKRVVMRVQVAGDGGLPFHNARPLYFRGTVLERYHARGGLAGRVWGWHVGSRADSDFRRFGLRPCPDSDNAALLVDDKHLGRVGPGFLQTYYLEPNNEPYLFACYPALEISSRDFDEVRKWIPDQVLQVDKPPGESLRYTVRSPVITSPWLAEALAEERPHGAEPAAHRPDPPLEREAEILALIDEVAGDVGPLDQPANRRAFVQRLERFLRSDAFTYTLRPPPIRPGAEPLGEFLLRYRRGHCEYFASALAVMCQLKGIPARLVNGYRTGDYNSLGDFYLVHERHAHAWVEVFIPGEDWVTFDPTPASSQAGQNMRLWFPQLQRYLSYFHFLWGNLVVEYDLGLRRQMFSRFRSWLMRPAQDQRTVVGAVAAFVRELFARRLDLSWSERLVYWVFALLMVALVALLAYVLVVVLWWLLSAVRRLRLAQTAGPSRGREVEFYQRFCRRLAAVGLRRRADQTPAEFARELAARSPTFADAPGLVHAYYEVAFGGHPLSPARRAGIEAFLNRLRQAMPSAEMNAR